MNENFYNDLLNKTNGTLFQHLVQSVIETSKEINFRDYLDFSYNKSICVSSDYSGEHEHLGSKYYTYTFTFQTFSTLQNWHTEIKKLKNEKNYNEKSPSYKGTKATTRKGKMPDWLDISETHFKGFVFCVAVPVNNVDSLFAPTISDLKNAIEESQGISCPFKEKILEKAHRIVLFLSLMLAFLIKEDENVFWMTDFDAILDNKKQVNFIKDLFGSAINSLVINSIDGKVSFGTPFYGDTDNFSEDFLSLSDLIAGALNDYCNIYNKELSPEDLYTQLKPKSIEILKRLTPSKIPTFIYIFENDSNNFKCSRVDIKVNE